MVAFLLVGAFACGARQETEAPRAAKLTAVKMNLNPTLTYAPLVIAKEEGYFEEEGIDARFVKLDPNSAIAATAAGDLDVLSAGTRSGFFNMMGKGARMRIVADRAHSGTECVSEAMIAPAAMADRIAANGGSLRGEKIAVIRGGMIEFLFDRMLEQRGNSYSEVVVMQMPQGSAPSLRERLDAVRYASEPDLSNATHDGWARIVASAESIEPGHESGVLIFGRRLLDDRETGVRVMRAYLRGVRRYAEGKTDRNVAIISQYTKLPPEIIRRACWTPVNLDGRVDPRAVQPFLDWAVSKTYVDRPMTVSEWWDPYFIREAAVPAKGR